jgi:phosphoenolpyruvate synthase/pyruvate phosphate dikinase
MHNNGLRYSIMTPLRNDCVLRSSARLGEAVVSGQVTPDTYVVNRQTGAVATTIGAKAQRIVSDGAQGVRVEDNAEGSRGESSLSDAQVRKTPTWPRSWANFSLL